MESWRDHLYKASIDAATFFVVRGDGVFGRRVHNHQFILRDSSDPEDLGGVNEPFTLEVFVVGDDYATEREKLVRALNRPGLREFTHPRLGVLTVQIGTVNWRFGLKNKETFVIRFFPKRNDSQLVSNTDTGAQLNGLCDSGLNALSDDFTGSFTVASFPAFVSTEAAELFASNMDVLKQLNGEAQKAIDEVSRINLAIDDAVDNVTDLIRAPLQLFSSVVSVVNNVLNIDDDIERAFGAYRYIETIWGEVDPVPVTTPSRQQQADNQAAMQRLFVCAAAIECARFVSEQASAVSISSNSESPFASADDAYTKRDQLVATLDAFATTGSDDFYRAVLDLESGLAAHIDAHGNSLPRVRTLRVQTTVPALVLAHQLYGDALKESDIVERNHLSHPLFIAANAELEVLESVNG